KQATPTSGSRCPVASLSTSQSHQPRYIHYQTASHTTLAHGQTTLVSRYGRSSVVGSRQASGSSCSALGRSDNAPQSSHGRSEPERSTSSATGGGSMIRATLPSPSMTRSF